tara:strand:+ start:811 stop:924 length:114 start_codon:yes stop_codon:yes gene_type:complete
MANLTPQELAEPYIQKKARKNKKITKTFQLIKNLKND